MRGHCTAFLTLFFTLFLLLSSPLCAAESRTTLKFVFPFGDNTRTISVCPVPNRVIGGCCSDTNRIFTRDNKKGCCPAGNDIETVGANQGCCYPVTPPQTRWGQTSSSPCGGYCANGSAVLSYSTISSCCADCPHTDDVRAFMSSSKVCGTCCSKIPDNCGNAGYRVCEEATGSAYCSVDPTKCIPATDWIVGTSGQGGYSCCASCAGTRYAHTSSDCGSCCATGTHSMLDYSGASACCTVAATNQTRWSQSATNVCGQFCTSPNVMVSYNGFSSCCSSCFGNSRSGQTTTNVCGNACCDIMKITGVYNGVPAYTTPECSCAAGYAKTSIGEFFNVPAGYMCCAGKVDLHFAKFLNGAGDANGWIYRSFNSDGLPEGDVFNPDQYIRCAGVPPNKDPATRYEVGSIWGFDGGQTATTTGGIVLYVTSISHHSNGNLAYIKVNYQLYCPGMTNITSYYSGKRLGTYCNKNPNWGVTYKNNSREISFSYY